MKRIFFVEDDLSLINGLSFAIKKQGYETDIAHTYLEAEKMWINGKYDLVILDVSLPDGSGYDLCKNIRKTSKVPIIFLTAADEETDIIMGLDIGGDDYITKPFGNGELRARVAAHLRREKREKRSVLSLDGIRFNLGAHEMIIGEQKVSLTKSEYAICEFLARSHGQVFSKEQIYEAVYGYEGEGDSSAIAEHVKNIRAKLSVYGCAPIETVWGIGYKWQ